MRIIGKKPPAGPESIQRENKDIAFTPLPAGLDAKIDLLTPYIEKSEDIIKRFFYVGSGLNIKAAAFYINAVIDKNTLHEGVLKPLMVYENPAEPGSRELIHIPAIISNTLLPVGDVKNAADLNSLVHFLYDGLLVLLFEGLTEAVVVDIHGGEYRQVDEPPGERSTRGPREGLIENLDVNIAMIRRRLRDPRLAVHKTTVGRRTRTPVAIMYVEDIADPNLVQELQRRLDAIDVDGIVASGYIEQYIEDSPWALFPQVWSTERPDKMTMKLLEGHVLIMTHGTPLALMVPTLLQEFMQASEDYYERPVVASYLRLFRFVAFFLAISLPALYIVLLSFQPEMVPLELLISLARARKQVPFPVVLETLIQEFIIQLVIESGLRLPASVGQTVGVVAGIILGQAAVAAKLASPGIIIFIAITTIATFTMPSSGLVLATRLLRVFMIIMAASFGLFGFSLGWLLILTHLVQLESFGVPYMAPFSPLRLADLKDSFVRTFLWKMEKRPVSIPHQDQTRRGDNKGWDKQGGQ